VTFKKNTKRKIIIAGGVGPSAGVDLHKKIIQSTQKYKQKKLSDQEHINVMHLSFSNKIYDRTAYLELEQNKKRLIENPGESMAKIVRKEVSPNEEVLIAVPCNTFHHIEIFNAFQNNIKNYFIAHKIINMIDVTVNSIKLNFQGIKKIGILSTQGTRLQKIYSDKLEALGLECVQVPLEGAQQVLNDVIYSEWGIKMNSENITEKSVHALNNLIEKYFIGKVEHIIFGCTELPLIYSKLAKQKYQMIDPTRVLSEVLVKQYLESE